MTVLICTQDLDPHADSVADAVKSLGGDYVFFKRYNMDNYLTYQLINSNINAWLNIDNKQYLLSKDITSIYWRLKPNLLCEVHGEESTIEDKFRMHEWKHIIPVMEEFVQKKNVNKICNQLKLNRKAFQLKLAIECNLKVPNTIITNSHLSILNKFKNQQIIYKTLSSFMTNGKLIFTNKVNSQDIFNNHETICLAPGIFQEVIEKSFELRVTVVGDTVFSVKIDSQKQKLTELDWRYDQREHMFSEGELSNYTKNALLDFHKKSGLVFAAYDFIVDKDGQEIFLECNPSGQWLFVGDSLGLSISNAIAKELVC